MGRAKRTRKFAQVVYLIQIYQRFDINNIQVKRIISRRDARLKNNNEKEPGSENRLVRHIPQAPSSLFFQANEALVPPYSVLVDTNFVSHTVRAKLDMRSAMMNLYARFVPSKTVAVSRLTLFRLYSNCTPIFTSCSIAELEKLGDKFKIALRIARDEGFQRLPCSHKGTYADDCIINLVCLMD